MPRRTQAERSAATQTRLLDAALDCLVERGYAGTTTTLVAARAGVSRGAQLHHYPARAALVAAAVEHLFTRLTRDYQDGFAALPAGADRLRAGIDLLWSVMSAPHYPAAIELLTAARTDADLRSHLAPVAARHEANVARLARAYFPEAARRGPRFEAALAVILDAMQGMAAARTVARNGADEATRLATLHEIAAHLLGAPSRREEPA